MNGNWMSEHGLLLTAIGGLYALTTGAYGWAWALYRRAVDAAAIALEKSTDLSQKALEKATFASAEAELIKTNHVAHLLARIAALERVAKGEAYIPVDAYGNPVPYDG